MLPEFPAYRSVNPRRPTPAAFTLIELLVVVAIIALLLSILLPSLNGARAQAKSTVCLSNVRSLGQMTQTFGLERNGLFQISSSENGLDVCDPARTKFMYGDGGELLAWPVALARASGGIFRNNRDWGVRAEVAAARGKRDQMSTQFPVAVCPADRVQLGTGYFPRGNGLKDPGDTSGPVGAAVSHWGKLSYGLNEDIAGIEDGINVQFYACWRAVRGGTSSSGCTTCQGGYTYGPSSPCFRNGERLRGRMDLIYQPATVALLVDAGPGNDEGQNLKDNANLINTWNAQGPYLGDAVQYMGGRVPTNRHPNGSVNVLYADAHGDRAKPVKWSNATATAPKLPKEYSPRVRVSPYSDCDAH
jgi:prepilin-type N-terminal cleavage/methylation domain-containing protein/prepilin-type processing-associated H-X9-DG protein